MAEKRWLKSEIIAYCGLCMSTKLFCNQSTVTSAYYRYDFRGNYWLLIAISQPNIRDEAWFNGTREERWLCVKSHYIETDQYLQGNKERGETVIITTEKEKERTGHHH